MVGFLAMMGFLVMKIVAILSWYIDSILGVMAKVYNRDLGQIILQVMLFGYGDKMRNHLLLSRVQSD